MPEKLEEMKAHNLQKVADVGAKTVVFTCPSCFHTWRHFYETDLKLMHATQLMAELIRDGKIELTREKTSRPPTTTPATWAAIRASMRNPVGHSGHSRADLQGVAHEPQIFRLLRRGRQCGDDRPGSFGQRSAQSKLDSVQATQAWVSFRDMVHHRLPAMRANHDHPRTAGEN
jgi:hypothetical protein